MHPSDAAFVMGPLLAPLAGALALVAVGVVRPARWVTVAMAVLLVLTGAAFVRYWQLWGDAFQRADAELDPLPAATAAQDLMIWLSGSGSALLAVSGVVVLWSARPRPSRPAAPAASEGAPIS